MLAESSILNNQETLVRGAIALNNDAVALLQHDSLCECLDFLRGGMHSMKASLFSSDDQQQHNHPEHCNATNQKIYHMRFIMEQVSRRYAVACAAPMHRTDWQCLKITSETNPCSILPTTNENMCGQRQSLYVVKIECLIDVKVQAEMDDLKLAFLLYNYAVMYYQMMSSQERSMECEFEKCIVRDGLKESLRLLMLCEILLMPRVVYHSIEFQSNPMLLLHVVLAQAIVKIACHLDCDDMNLHYTNRLARIADMIDKPQVVLRYGHFAAASA